MKPVVDRAGARKADLAAIHIAKKALGWDDSTYRDIMFSVCRVKSSAELDFTGRRRFLAHLRACGWSGDSTSSGRTPGSTDRPVSKPLTPLQRKMWSLWMQLADAGLIDNRKMPALLTYVTRQTGVDRLEWLNDKQADLVIESLKAWLKRGRSTATGGAS